MYHEYVRYETYFARVKQNMNNYSDDEKLTDVQLMVLCRDIYEAVRAMAQFILLDEGCTDDIIQCRTLDNLFDLLSSRFELPESVLRLKEWSPTINMWGAPIFDFTLIDNVSIVRLRDVISCIAAFDDWYCHRHYSSGGDGTET